MTATALRQVILDLTVEDSFSLPELVARALGQQPDQPEEAVRRAVQACVIEMFEQGLLAVVRQTSPGENERALGDDAAARALADLEEWIDGPGWRAHTRVVATPRGHSVYEAGP
jgi:hypothetical protein